MVTTSNATIDVLGTAHPDGARRNSPELLIEFPHSGLVLDSSRSLLSVGVSGLVLGGF